MINVATNTPSPCAQRLASHHTVVSIAHVPYHRWQRYDDSFDYDSFEMNDLYVVWPMNVVCDDFVDWYDSVETVVSNESVDLQHFVHCSVPGGDGKKDGDHDRHPRDGSRGVDVEKGGDDDFGKGDEGPVGSHTMVDRPVGGPHRRHCDRCPCGDDTIHTMTTTIQQTRWVAVQQKKDDSCCDDDRHCCGDCHHRFDDCDG